ncbi:MAG TPA: MerR family transcriptional regulator [Pilimelia sp.]|nr:MerR family transcriptional regulator [Pilimelia sp.]
MADLLRIGEVAAAAGVSPRTVDHYTSLGLLTAVERSAGNYRLYDPASVDQIGLIQRLEAYGVPLADIARGLHGAGGGDVSAVFARVAGDLETLQRATASLGAEAHGLLGVIAARVHGLISLALEVTLTITPG